MKQEIHLSLPPEIAYNEELLLKQMARKAKVNPEDISYYKFLLRSIDARKKDILVHLKILVYARQNPPLLKPDIPEYPYIHKAPEVIVIGAGPAGLFAALELIEKGFRPILLERGKMVNERKKDIALLHRNLRFSEDSNYCFGEGGAGTFSDGKLYTRSKKKGDIGKVLNLFHHFGAADSILYDAHPHIGSDKLPGIIKNMRNFILERGGEVHFETRVDDFIIENRAIKKIKTSKGDFNASKVMLAAGHSARDIYYALHAKDVKLEPKPFAMGVRVEHPQYLIDRIQYHRRDRGLLPAAEYKLVEHIDERAVFSFCMCPGGFIVPSASSANEMVVNGMSPSKRNSPFANSGIVVQVKEHDFYKNGHSLSGIDFQKSIENQVYQYNSVKYITPAQRLVDFCNNRSSSSLPDCSYNPGIIPGPVHELLPLFVKEALQKAFPRFDQKMKGYFTNEAIVVGVESRTSSPIRIPRDRDTFVQIQINNLYPCGEGAGYAGGITSSAIDGMNAATAVAQSF